MRRENVVTSFSVNDNVWFIDYRQRVRSGLLKEIRSDFYRSADGIPEKHYYMGNPYSQLSEWIIYFVEDNIGGIVELSQIYKSKDDAKEAKAEIKRRELLDFEDWD